MQEIYSAMEESTRRRRREVGIPEACPKCAGIDYEHIEGATWECRQCGSRIWPLSKIGPSLAGIGPDAPTIQNERGAKESQTQYRFDLIDARALFRLAHILDYGAKKYGDNNWRGLPLDTNINHALIHIYAHLAGDTQDDHLGHALCRLHFALAIHLAEQEQPTRGS
jgi:hypothetical protein